MKGKTLDEAYKERIRPPLVGIEAFLETLNPIHLASLRKWAIECDDKQLQRQCADELKRRVSL